MTTRWDQAPSLRDLVILEAAAIVATLVLLFAIIGIFYGGQRQLAHRIDRNSARGAYNALILRAQNASMYCILLVPPDQRTVAKIGKCRAHSARAFNIPVGRLTGP